MARRFACVLLGALMGCAESPAVPFPGGPGFDAGGRVFADTVIAYRNQGQTTSCSATLPACGDAPSSCAANAVLGANDGATFMLDGGGTVELAFRCDLVTNEIKIWATVPAGAEAVLEVSFDGSRFRTLGVLDERTSDFYLQRIPIDKIRFVRIADRSGGGIGIDAVEGLR